jgi:hypothetical protein
VLCSSKKETAEIDLSVVPDSSFICSYLFAILSTYHKIFLHCN